MNIDFSKSDQINSWPFQEARLIKKKISKQDKRNCIKNNQINGQPG